MFNAGNKTTGCALMIATHTCDFASFSFHEIRQSAPRRQFVVVNNADWRHRNRSNENSA